MRRPLVLLLSALAAVALTAGAATFAIGSDEASKPAPAAKPAAPAVQTAAPTKANGGRGHGALARMVLGSMAERLGVERAALRTAVREVVREQWRKRKGSARSARRLPSGPELADLKGEVATSLAGKLDVDEAKLLDAARAELSARLDQGEKLGMITAKGRTLALACFDDPAGCDLRALKGEVKLPFGQHGKRPRYN